MQYENHVNCLCNDCYMRKGLKRSTQPNSSIYDSHNCAMITDSICVLSFSFGIVFAVFHIFFFVLSFPFSLYPSFEIYFCRMWTSRGKKKLLKRFSENKHITNIKMVVLKARDVQHSRCCAVEHRENTKETRDKINDFKRRKRLIC